LDILTSGHLTDTSNKYNILSESLLRLIARCVLYYNTSCQGGRSPPLRWLGAPPLDPPARGGWQGIEPTSAIRTYRRSITRRRPVVASPVREPPCSPTPQGQSAFLPLGTLTISWRPRREISLSHPWTFPIDQGAYRRSTGPPTRRTWRLASPPAPDHAQPTARLIRQPLRPVGISDSCLPTCVSIGYTDGHERRRASHKGATRTARQVRGGLSEAGCPCGASTARVHARLRGRPGRALPTSMPKPKGENDL